MSKKIQDKIELLNLSDVDLCPSCGSEEIGCVESRNTGIRFRVKRCNNCKHKFKTYEVSEEDLMRLRKVCEFL